MHIYVYILLLGKDVFNPGAPVKDCLIRNSVKRKKKSGDTVESRIMPPPTHTHTQAFPQWPSRRHPAELSRVRTGAASLSKRATMSVDGSQKRSSKPGVDFRLELFLKVCNSEFRNCPGGGLESSVKV